MGQFEHFLENPGSGAFTQSKNFQIVGFEHPNIRSLNIIKTPMPTFGNIYRTWQKASAMYRLPNHNHILLLNIVMTKKESIEFNVLLFGAQALKKFSSKKQIIFIEIRSSVR